MYLAKNSANNVPVPQLSRVRQSGSLLNMGPFRRMTDGRVIFSPLTDPSYTSTNSALRNSYAISK